MNPMGAGAASDDADLNAIMVPKTAKLGGGALLLLGVLTLVLFLQTVLIVQVILLTIPILVVMFALGVACSVSGFRLTRGSGKAAVWGCALAAVTFSTAGGWFAFALYRGVFSLLSLALMPLAVVALICSAFSIALARQADHARARLRAQGLDPGL